LKHTTFQPMTKRLTANGSKLCTFKILCSKEC